VGSTVNAVAGNALKFHTQTINLHAKTNYRDGEENPLLQWSPTIQLQLANARADIQNLENAVSTSISTLRNVC